MTKKVVVSSSSTEEIKLKNPRSLKVYDKCKKLTREVYKLVEQFPDKEKYGITNQIIRSASSIGANLAEGNGQIYVAKEISFLNNSLGSANETIYWLEVAYENNYISTEQFKNTTEAVEEIIRILFAMMKKLRNSNSTS